MAMGAPHIAFTAPAFAAAIGIYFFDRIHSNKKELGGGRLWRPVVSSVAKVKEEVKSSEMPKLAPQFDGLHSFETLVG